MACIVDVKHAAVIGARDFKHIAGRIVVVAGGAIQRIGDFDLAPDRIVSVGGGCALGVDDFDGQALGVIVVVRDAAQRVGYPGAALKGRIFEMVVIQAVVAEL